MAVNLSSSLNYTDHCSTTAVGVFIVTAFLVTKVLLLLPLALFILYLGHQRWRQQGSFAATSHSDIFTYHFAAMSVIFAMGSTIYFYGQYSGLTEVITVGHYFGSVILPGEISFHTLACVERYLAVVHPVVYLGLKQSAGVRIRNISIGCIWLLWFGWIGLAALYYPDLTHTPMVFFLFLSLVVVSFCSLSVLCVLIHSGRRKMGGGRVQVKQPKKRALYTITVILGVLWLFIFGYIVCVALNKSHALTFSGECLVLLLGNFATLPSSFVLPLLFLHRAGKLLCCHCSN